MRLNQSESALFPNLEVDSKKSRMDYLNTMRGQSENPEAVDAAILPLLKGKSNIADKPVYEELKKIPLSQQIEMTKGQQLKLKENKDQDNDVYFEKGGEKERRERMLEELYGKPSKRTRNV